MTHREILLIADHGATDGELVEAAVAHHPHCVTVLIEAHDPTWGSSESRLAIARRERLATLLTAIERATGATVVGLIGDAAELREQHFDAIVGGRDLLSAA